MHQMCKNMKPTCHNMDSTPPTVSTQRAAIMQKIFRRARLHCIMLNIFKKHKIVNGNVFKIRDAENSNHAINDPTDQSLNS